MKNVSFAMLLTALAAPSVASNCSQTVYLTFDTGNQSQAVFIAKTLHKHGVKATFFLANEKTTWGDYSLDSSWADYWKSLVDHGHAFGSHTFDHVYLMASAPGVVRVKAQFGQYAGQIQHWTAQQYCEEIDRVKVQFKRLTGQNLDPIWRAPGGRVSAETLKSAKQCGYQHIAWSNTGFSGDELSSEQYSNQVLLQSSLSRLKDGDVFIAHLGIWSRKHAWAPEVLEPLIVGLKKKGTCFATLKQHPDYAGHSHNDVLSIPKKP